MSDPQTIEQDLEILKNAANALVGVVRDLAPVLEAAAAAIAALDADFRQVSIRLADLEVRVDDIDAAQGEANGT